MERERDFKNKTKNLSQNSRTKLFINLLFFVPYEYKATMMMSNDDPTAASSSPPTATMETLRQLASSLCKQIDIGTAILPKPLFVHDDQEVKGEKMGNATIACASQKEEEQGEETRYAKIVQSEFNAVVIEVSYFLFYLFSSSRTKYTCTSKVNFSEKNELAIVVYIFHYNSTSFFFYHLCPCKKCSTI